MAEAQPLLRVDGLKTHFHTRDGVVRAVDGVSFDVMPGQTLAIVGESGCGKSVTAMSILRLLPMPPARIAAGRVEFEGRNLLDLGEPEMRAVRGNLISMIFQEPMTSLNPVLTIGRQVAEVLVLHRGLSEREALAQAVEGLRKVQISEPERRARQYPHELSGGMRQRVMIAMALACGPRLLIADEPTTALDVTIQAQILDLMRKLGAETGASIILITHDLGVVAEMAQRVVVMYAGRKVEEASVEQLFAHPRHPYTRGLLGSMPHLGQSLSGDDDAPPQRLVEIPGMVPSLKEAMPGCLFAALPERERRVPQGGAADAGLRGGPPGRLLAPDQRTHTGAWFGPPDGGERMSAAEGSKGLLLDVQGLRKHYATEQGWLGRSGGKVLAVDGVSFGIAAGETLGLVGESGCGKSTTGKLILRLQDPTAGRILWRGQPIEALSQTQMRPVRRELQAVFQDPYSSLNPRIRAADIVAEPLRNFETMSDAAANERVAALFQRVGLRPDQMVKYPFEFSGGQRQRLGIARALSVQPKLIVCDEPVSALDVSVQAQVINLLMDLQAEFHLSYLFIAHDLAVVEHISHRVAVMYLGKIVEIAPRKAIFSRPLHPYTEALLDAVPVPDPLVRKQRRVLTGDVPSPMNPPPGCRFHTRCPYAEERCRREEPPLQQVEPGQWVACHLRQPAMLAMKEQTAA